MLVYQSGAGLRQCFTAPFIALNTDTEIIQAQKVMENTFLIKIYHISHINQKKPQPRVYDLRVVPTHEVFYQ